MKRVFEFWHRARYASEASLQKHYFENKLNTTVRFKMSRGSRAHDSRRCPHFDSAMRIDFDVTVFTLRLSGFSSRKKQTNLAALRTKTRFTAATERKSHPLPPTSPSVPCPPTELVTLIFNHINTRGARFFDSRSTFNPWKVRSFFSVIKILFQCVTGNVKST